MVKVQEAFILKKAIGYNFIYILLIAGMAYQVKHVSHIVAWILGGIAISFWLVRLVWDLIKRDYIVCKGKKITIKDNFRTKMFEQSDIEYIALNYSPFSQTYFRLKNGEKVHFNSWQLNKSDTAKLQFICSDIR